VKTTRRNFGSKPFRRDTLGAPTVQGDDANPCLSGYIAKFGVESEILYDEDICDEGFVEVLAPGVFDESLANNDIVALYNHDASKPLGRMSGGTLTLSVDAIGLAFRNLLANTTHARDAREDVRVKNIEGCSFGFCIVESTLEYREGLPPLHTLSNINMHEVSPAVTFPAYTPTEVYARARRPAQQPTDRRAIDRARRLSALWFLASS
jgi:HK97 family phage prohead protease